MRRRRYLALTGAVVPLAGCVGDTADSNSDSTEPMDAPGDETDDNTTDQTDSGDESTPDNGDPEPSDTESNFTTLESVWTQAERWDDRYQKISGDGDRAETIEVSDGFTVFRSTLHGETLEDLAQMNLIEDDEIIATVGGGGADKVGVTTSHLESREYELDVVAEMPWELEIVQPDLEDLNLVNPPASYSLDSDDHESLEHVIGPIELSGEETVHIVHEDIPGRVLVMPYPHDESRFDDREVWFNETTGFEGETQNSFSGTTWIFIHAIGSFTIEIE